jgi:hypothetical protein
LHVFVAVCEAGDRPVGRLDVLDLAEAKALYRGPAADKVGDEVVGWVGQDLLWRVVLGDLRLLL